MYRSDCMSFNCNHFYTKYRKAWASCCHNIKYTFTKKRVLYFKITIKKPQQTKR